MTRKLTVLLVKPKARLRTILSLQRLQLLEPIELGYIAAAVPAPHDVSILDLRFARNPIREFQQAVKRLRPDVIGITGYSHESNAVKALATEARASAPAAKVIVGGHHATVAAHDLAIPEIDAIVRGEGCIPFRAIVERISQNDSIEGIPSVFVPATDDISIELEWPQFPDPSTLPSPRRDLFDPQRYYCVWVREEAASFGRLYVPTSMVRTSFGCRMKCSFCIVPKIFNGRHQPRPAEAVAEEIASLPTNHVYFCDDENFIDPDFAHELADALERRGVKKRYFAWTRATTVNRFPELFRRWRALGLDAAFLGFEYPTDEQLRDAKKGSTVAQNEQAHTTLRAHGIAVHAAFMLQPDFEEQHFARLRSYVAAMPPAQFSITVCTPSPGTDDYAVIRDSIWAENEFDLHDCMHPLTPTKLPLREFARLYAQQISEAGKKNPLRAAKRGLHPLDIFRVIKAQMQYEHAFATIHHDYPKELR